MKEWLRYLAIRSKAMLTQNTVINMFGNTYIVYGNTVQFIGQNPKHRNYHGT